jgi:hypothetical protein
MHALIINGVVAKYPYTIGNLRRDNPNTSFPKHPSNELLAQWGMHLVAKVDRPSTDQTKNVNEGTPVFVDGTWTQVWEVTDATAEDVVERIEQQGTSIRSQRDALLSETDWMALSDNTLSAEWATYRQALRDITSHANFPYLNETDWPVKP